VTASFARLDERLTMEARAPVLDTNVRDVFLRLRALRAGGGGSDG